MSQKQNKSEIKEPIWVPFENCIGLILSGTALGWIIGMSETHIIKDILLPLFAVIITILGLMYGFKSLDLKNGFFSIFSFLQKNKATSVETKEVEQVEIEPVETTEVKETSLEIKKSLSENELPKTVKPLRILPIGFFLMFLSFGAAAGLYMKNNFILGTNYKKLALEFELPDSTYNNRYKEIVFGRRIGVLRDSISKIDSNMMGNGEVVLKMDETNKEYFATKAQMKVKPDFSDQIDYESPIENKPKNPRVVIYPEGRSGLNDTKKLTSACGEGSLRTGKSLLNWILQHTTNEKEIERIRQIPFDDSVNLKIEFDKICKPIKK